ncbi:MAG: transglycosylase SLT domain-containing protein [Arenimonas sp.]
MSRPKRLTSHRLPLHVVAAVLGFAGLAGCATTVPVATAPPVQAPAPVATLPADAPMPPADGIDTTTPPLDTVVVAGIPATGIPIDPTQATGREVFDRLRARLRAPACVDSGRARQWQDRYAHHPTVFTRKLESILPMLDFVIGETERSGLPGEFVFIPLVESWYEPGAIGHGGPAGMWQMIGSTARNHGVGMRKGYDGRLSPVDSTRAALSYLKALDDMFDGDWQATVMAYNAGEYRLAGALRRSGARRVSAADGLPAGMSHITYDYVSKLQALSCLVSEPEKFGLDLPDDARFARLAPVLVDRRVGTLEQVAARTRLPASTLRGWNPAYRGGRIVDGAPRLLLMPASAASALVEGAAALADTPLPAPADPGADAPTSATHRVRSGDTLSHIARRYGLSLAALLRLNGLGNRSMIRPGQVLRLVP